jgi:hypothetical protein
MKLLFWNLFNKCNDHFIVDIIEENNIDIAIFTEKNATNFDRVLAGVGNRFVRAYEFEKNAKVTLYHRSTYNVCVEAEKRHYSIYSVETDTKKYIIAGVHLPANPRADDGNRKVITRKIIEKINSLEADQGHDNTLVIGDFNANPFDEELVQKDAFNAVLFKKLIYDQEYIVLLGDEYKRFYNPMLHYISEENMSYGSYYYNSSESTSLYWNCYDQVITRKSLANLITNVAFCKRIGNQPLMNEVMPNKNISDHLPLIVNIREDR